MGRHVSITLQDMAWHQAIGKLIADRLGISDHTAKFHVNGVMAKLGSSTRTEAVVEAVRRGLVNL